MCDPHTVCHAQEFDNPILDRGEYISIMHSVCLQVAVQRDRVMTRKNTRILGAVVLAIGAVMLYLDELAGIVFALGGIFLVVFPDAGQSDSEKRSKWGG